MSQRTLTSLLLVGDLLALILFVAVGQRDHELVNAQNPFGGLLLAAMYFVGPYVLAGWAFHIFNFEAAGEGRFYFKFFARWLNAWLVAAPLGILLRALVLGRAVIPTMFIVAGMSFGALFLLLWRVGFTGWYWFKNRKTI